MHQHAYILSLAAVFRVRGWETMMRGTGRRPPGGAAGAAGEEGAACARGRRRGGRRTRRAPARGHAGRSGGGAFLLGPPGGRGCSVANGLSTTTKGRLVAKLGNIHIWGTGKWRVPLAPNIGGSSHDGAGSASAGGGHTSWKQRCAAAQGAPSRAPHPFQKPEPRQHRVAAPGTQEEFLEYNSCTRRPHSHRQRADGKR